MDGQMIVSLSQKIYVSTSTTEQEIDLAATHGELVEIEKAI
jgi:hypothetical protein